jgi:voltage-gated potassium channel
VYPVTVGGRVFTSLILVIGLGIVAVPTGLLASALSKAREMERDEEQDDATITGYAPRHCLISPRFGAFQYGGIA